MGRRILFLIFSGLLLNHVPVLFVRTLAPRSLLRSVARSPRVGRSLFGQRGPPDLGITEEVPSWEEIRQKLGTLQTPAEQAFRQHLTEGTGPPNAMANLRIFDKGSSAAKKVTLYRDSASWCPYCQKVWMLLEEKQIPYHVKRVNMNCYGSKPSDFWALQPNGCIPVAVMEDGSVLGSSNEIIQKLLAMKGASPELDDALDPFDDPRSNQLIRLDSQLGGGWLDWVRGGGNGASFKSSLAQMEAALSEDQSGPYLLGDRFSLIDIMYMPYFERAVASLAYFKGFNIRDRETYPAVNAWLDAMDSRPSVRASKSDYYSHCKDLPPQIGFCNSEGRGAEAREEVDGGSWQFPLTAVTEPDWDWISSAEARREAVERMSHRPESIARFAARGASKMPGFPQVSAELADPNAQPAEDWIPAIDVFLRHAAAMLLAGDEAADRGDDTSPERAAAWEAVQKTVASIQNPTSRVELADCLGYLQKRIGVPRDMSLPAARRLRAELGKLMDELRSGQ